MTTNGSPRLEFSHIGKTFPGVRALADVGFQVRAGSVHGLLGENGAGKSTMMKILGGEYVPDEGEVAIDGQVRHFRSAADAIAAGVAVIHQELQYVPELSVMENLLLGRLPTRFGFVDRRRALAWTRERLDALGVDLDPRARLKQLSIGQRQMVEIVKAILRDATILALDEPTSSLSHRETDVLFRLVRDLRAQGKAMIYISHRLDEIFELCDAATIFRDGRKVADFDTLEGVTRDVLVQRMVGREITQLYPDKLRPDEKTAETILEVDGIGDGSRFQNVSFNLRKGEILGIGGLIGSGRTEIAESICGLRPRTEGMVRLHGAVQKIATYSDAVKAGIVYLSEDRKGSGVFLDMSIAQNISVLDLKSLTNAAGLLDGRAEAALAEDFARRLAVRMGGIEAPVKSLSGGNQQKVAIAKQLAVKPKVILMDEPTRGIDVGAKTEIHRLLRELAGSGIGIVVISSEMPELLGLCDRVLVVREGRIAGELGADEMSEEAVIRLASGLGAARVADHAA